MPLACWLGDMTLDGGYDALARESDVYSLSVRGGPEATVALSATDSPRVGNTAGCPEGR